MIYEELFRQFGESSYAEFNLVQGERELKLLKNPGKTRRPAVEMGAGDGMLSDSERVSVDKEAVKGNSETEGRLIRAGRVGFFKSVVKVGDVLLDGQPFGYISAMNIPHEQKIVLGGVVRRVLVADGDGVAYGDSVIELE